MRSPQERGAVAVEMALLLPVLVLMLLGIVEFGRAYNAQVTLTNAAREGVRVMALTNSQAQAALATRSAAVTLTPTATNSSVSFSTNPTSAPASCTYVPTEDRKQVTVTFTYQLTTLTGIAGPFSMTGKGTMLCGG